MIQLHTEIQIDAPLQTVWAILAEFDAYALWNPFIPFAKGVAAAGETLSVQIAPPGLSRSRYSLTVLEAEPERCLRWIGHLFTPGLMDGDHRFVLEPQRNGGMRLIQSEEFRGVLVPFLSPWLKGNMRRGFEAMNQAVKARAEALRFQKLESKKEAQAVA